MGNGIIDMKNIKKKLESKDFTEEEKLNAQLKTAQANGYIEIKKYEELTNNYIVDICNLAIAEKIINEAVMDQINYLLISQILNTIIKPVFKGIRPASIPEEIFDDMRKDMYMNLITKYVDKEE